MNTDWSQAHIVRPEEEGSMAKCIEHGLQVITSREVLDPMTTRHYLACGHSVTYTFEVTREVS